MKEKIIRCTEVPADLPESIFRSERPHFEDLYNKNVEHEAGAALLNAKPPPPPPEGETSEPKSSMTYHQAQVNKVARERMNTQQRRNQMAKAPVKTIMTQPTPEQPAPEVPVVKVRPITEWEQKIHRYANAVMSRPEYDIYVITWNLWVEAYGTSKIPPSDLDDIHSICMNTVREMREEKIRAERPHLYSQKTIDAARSAVEKAKANLASRKIDVLSIAAKKDTVVHNHMNIAVMAGNASSEDGRQQLQAKVLANRQKIDGFFANTEAKTTDPSAHSGMIEFTPERVALPAAPVMPQPAASEIKE